MNFDISVGMILAENNKDQLLKDVTKNNPSVALNAIKYLLKKQKPIPGHLILTASERLGTSLRVYQHFILAKKQVPDEIVNSLARDSESSLDVLKLLVDRLGIRPDMENMHPKLYRSIAQSPTYSDEAYRTILKYNNLAKKIASKIVEVPQILIDSIASDPVQSLSLIVYLMRTSLFKEKIPDVFIDSVLNAEDYPEYAQELANFMNEYAYQPDAKLSKALEKRGIKI